MSENSKKWYQSKAIWSAILIAVLSCIEGVSVAFGKPIVPPNWLIGMLGAFGIYGIRDGKKPLE